MNPDKFCVLGLHALYFRVRQDKKIICMGYVFIDRLTKEDILEYVRKWVESEEIEMLA